MAIPARLLPVEVDWIRPASTTDSYGNTVDDWDEEATTTSQLQVWVDHRRTVEQRDGRDVTVTTLLLITNELGVAAIDRFAWGDHTYEVDGEPAVVYTPAGPHHVEAALRLVVG